MARSSHPRTGGTEVCARVSRMVTMARTHRRRPPVRRLAGPCTNADSITVWTGPYSCRAVAAHRFKRGAQVMLKRAAFLVMQLDEQSASAVLVLDPADSSVGLRADFALPHLGQDDIQATAVSDGCILYLSRTMAALGGMTEDRHSRLWSATPASIRAASNAASGVGPSPDPEQSRILSLGVPSRETAVSSRGRRSAIAAGPRSMSQFESPIGRSCVDVRAFMPSMRAKVFTGIRCLALSVITHHTSHRQ